MSLCLCVSISVCLSVFVCNSNVYLSYISSPHCCVAVSFLHTSSGLPACAIGIYAIWFQVVFVFAAAVGIYCFQALTGSVVMIVAVLCSRAGLWLFDLCARQISQETIDEDSRGVINGQWESLRSFFNFTSFGLACLFSGESQPQPLHLVLVMS